MTNVLRDILHSLRRHQVFTLSTGILAANVASLLAMPWLTRLYAVESFGYFAVYWALCNLVGLFSTLRLELTIPIAENESEARRLSALASWLTCGCVAVMLALSLLPPVRALITSFPSDLAPWLLTVLSSLFVGWMQTATQSCLRAGRLTHLSLRHLVDRGGFIGLAIVLAHYGFDRLGLIVAQTVSLGLSLALLRTGSPLYLFVADKRLKALLHKYRDFPQKTAPSAILQMLTSQLPILAYSSLFPAREIGYLSLAQRLIDAPNTVVQGSLSAVYYRRLAGAQPSEYRRIFTRTLLWSVLAFGVPCAIAAIYARDVMRVGFGPEWAASGLYFICLLPAAFTRLVFLVQQTLFYVLRRLDLELYTSVALFVAQMTAIAVGLSLGASLLTPILSGSVLTALVFTWSLARLWREVKARALTNVDPEPAATPAVRLN